jgi:hypothetical protein
VRQVKSEEVNLALYATDDADGFTKVCLLSAYSCDDFPERPFAAGRNWL